MKSIGTGGVELLIYEISIEPDREMRVSRGALHSFGRASSRALGRALYKASIELHAELR